VSWPRAALGNLKTAFAGIYHAFGSAEYAARISLTPSSA
jgi:hypothetical protein